MLETKTKNTKEEYTKAATAVGLLGLLSLLKDFEKKEDYEECSEILKSLEDLRNKHEKALKYKLPLKIEDVKKKELLLVGKTFQEQKEVIENQKQRIILWLAK